MKLKTRLLRFLWAKPEKGDLRYRLALVVQQGLGFDFKRINLTYYAFPSRLYRVKPPPFTPWYVGQRRLPQLLRVKALGLPASQAIPSESRGFLTGEAFSLKGVDLPAGSPRFLTLEEDRFQARYFAEVPAYAYPKALMVVRFVPGVYIPKGKTRIFLNQIELPPRVLPAFLPGKKTFLYLGEDPWLKVGKKVLKDFNEEVGVFKKKRRHHRVWRIKIESFHPHPIDVKLVERIPVSHREEIKVLAKADPPWDEISPKGKAVWRFRLSPNQSRVVTIKTTVEYPSSSLKGMR